MLAKLDDSPHPHADKTFSPSRSLYPLSPRALKIHTFDDLGECLVRDTLYFRPADKESLPRSPPPNSNASPRQTYAPYDPAFPGYNSTPINSQFAAETSNVSDADDQISIYASPLKSTPKTVGTRIIEYSHHTSRVRILRDIGTSQEFEPTRDSQRVNRIIDARPSVSRDIFSKEKCSSQKSKFRKHPERVFPNCTLPTSHVRSIIVRPGKRPSTNS